METYTLSELESLLDHFTGLYFSLVLLLVFLFALLLLLLLFGFFGNCSCLGLGRLAL